MQEQANNLFAAVSVFKVAGGKEGAQRLAAKLAARQDNKPAVTKSAATAVASNVKERRKERRLAATKEFKEDKDRRVEGVLVGVGLSGLFGLDSFF